MAVDTLSPVEGPQTPTLRVPHRSTGQPVQEQESSPLPCGAGVQSWKAPWAWEVTPARQHVSTTHPHRLQLLQFMRGQGQ